MKMDMNSLCTGSIDLIFFFDKSGSVRGTETTMAKYFIKTINKYKNNGSNINVSLILFSEDDEILYYRSNINSVNKINYYAIGGTSLYDCLHKNISKILNSQMDHNEVNSKKFVTIMTDGDDTTSQKYSKEDIEKLVNYTKTLGWEYILLSECNIIGSSFISIYSDHIAAYLTNDSLDKCFTSMENAIDSYLAFGNVSDDWKKPLEKTLRITKKGE